MDQWETIANRLKTLRIPVILSARGVDIYFQTLIAYAEKQQIALENKIPPDLISAFLNAPDFGLQLDMYKLQAKQISTDGLHLLFPVAHADALSETRQTERFSFQADEGVICEIQHPFDQATILTKTVLDLSAQGLSLRSAKASRLLQPGMYLPQVRVIVDGEPYVTSSAMVVYTRKLQDLKHRIRVQVGLKFDSATSQS